MDRLSEQPAGLTVGQLAERVGMTVRNVRAYRSRSLLPAPTMSGRVGYYSEEHVARLRHIRQLQRAGFNLAAIAAVLREPPADAASSGRGVLAGWLEEEPLVLDQRGMRELFGHDPVGDEVLDEIIALRLIEHLPDGRYRLPSRPLAAAVARLFELGLSRRAVLDLQRELVPRSRAIAHQFVEATLPQSCAEPGRPGSDAAEQAALELRRVVGRVLVATFALQVRWQLEAPGPTASPGG